MNQTNNVDCCEKQCSALMDTIYAGDLIENVCISPTGQCIDINFKDGTKLYFESKLTVSNTSIYSKIVSGTGTWGIVGEK